MAAMIGVIGMVSGVLQNIMTPLTWMAPQHPSHTRVRVYAGLSGGGTESTSGNIPGVALWNSNGGFIGKAMGVYNYVIDEGKFYDLEVKGKKQSAAYLSVSAFGKDSLCVAAVGVTSPTGFHAGWFGDVGMQCGAPWYPSNLVIPGSNPEARPACVWIVQGGVNNHPYTSMTMHLPSFTGDGLAQEYNTNVDTMCRSVPRFSMWKKRSVHMTLPVYQGGIQFNDDGSDKDIDAILKPTMMSSETTAPNDPTGTKLGVAADPSAEDPGPVTQLSPGKRRVKRAVLQPLDDQLIISNITSHSAKELCESHTSAGPDFVSTIERLFCDMAEKVLWPLCSEDSSYACFDLDAKKLRWGGVDATHGVKSELRVRSEDVSEKSYRSVQNWQ